MNMFQNAEYTCRTKVRVNLPGTRLTPVGYPSSTVGHARRMRWVLWCRWQPLQSEGCQEEMVEVEKSQLFRQTAIFVCHCLFYAQCLITNLVIPARPLRRELVQDHPPPLAKTLQGAHFH